MSKEILNTEHPKFTEFCERLEGPEGCNFKQTDPKDDSSITWKCKGLMNKSLACKILKTMDGIDIPATLRYFEDHGGHCDCEILFNVADVLETR